MKIIASVVCALWACCSIAQPLPAFLGAEGVGKWAKGGRRGKVIVVENLNDSGQGSLRSALDQRGPRTIVFRVSGTIELSKPLRVLHPFVTVAGQTAPGDGICLKGAELQIGTTHDVIVQHVRVRPGDKTSKASEMDAISVFDATDVIVDHCSATWSTDECLSVTGKSDRVTVQHCLIAEALTDHAYGSIIASDRGAISFLHNLYACTRTRNPRPGMYYAGEGDHPPGPRIDFRNNVIFNWQWGAGYCGNEKAGKPDVIAMNYVGNYLRPGMDTTEAYRFTAFTLFPISTMDVHLAGNVFDPPLPRGLGASAIIAVRPGATMTLRKEPLSMEAPAAVSAKSAYETALKGAGCTKPLRDALDAAIVQGVKSGSGRIRMTIAADDWPALRSSPALPDSDEDGLPDQWEQAHGTNYLDGTDASKASPQGWTFLELWLHSLNL